MLVLGIGQVILVLALYLDVFYLVALDQVILVLVLYAVIFSQVVLVLDQALLARSLSA